MDGDGYRGKDTRPHTVVLYNFFCLALSMLWGAALQLAMLISWIAGWNKQKISELEHSYLNRIKIPGIHFQDQNMEQSSNNYQTINRNAIIQGNAQKLYVYV